jgi:ketosteroid isomerase-like protein
MTLLNIATAYLDGLEQQDPQRVSGLLSDNATIVIPLSNTGGLDPWFRFEGKEAVLSYLGTIFTNFEKVRLLDRDVFADESRGAVFVETTGDLIQRGTGANYRNRYVFKFTIREGKVSQVSEYANPVPFAKLMRMHLG